LRSTPALQQHISGQIGNLEASKHEWYCHHELVRQWLPDSCLNLQLQNPLHQNHLVRQLLMVEDLLSNLQQHQVPKLAENKNTKLGHHSIEHLCHAIQKMVAGQQEPQKKANLAPTA